MRDAHVTFLFFTDLFGRDQNWEGNTLLWSPAEADGPHPKFGVDVKTMRTKKV